jgi:hypothetical protein
MERKQDFRRTEQEIKYIEKKPRFPLSTYTPPRGSGAAANRWFYLTGSVSAATVSGSGVSASVLTQGSGTARICKTDASGVVKPNTTVADITIFNGLNGSIASGQFVFCNTSDGNKWVITLVWC